MNIKSALVFGLWWFLPSMVLAMNKGNKGNNGNKAIPCSEADPPLVMADDIVNESGDGPFDGFPCGKYPFDPSQPQETLNCNYFPKFQEYECVLDQTKAAVVVADVLDTFQGMHQPCTAKGYKLSGNIRTWWWLCVKEE